jgi:hypothetical protein
VTSNAATVTVNPLTTITTQPTAQISCEGYNVNLSVVAAGTSPLTYQWKYGAANIAGETASSLALNNIVASSSGNYSVVVTGGCGASTSLAAPVTVNTIPNAFVVSSTAAATCQNAVNTLSTSATANITFQVGTATGSSVAANTPYRQAVAVNPNSKVQYVILASELATLGLSGSTSLSSLGFNVINAQAGSMLKYYISMANTTESSIGANFIDTSLLAMTNVYTAPNYQPVS